MGISTFRHHQDGWIYIGDHCYSLLWFVQQEPNYFLPEGAISREYIPNERHSLYSRDSQWGGELPWAEGDRYLSKASEYEKVWQALNQAEPIPEPELQPNWIQFRAQVSMHSAYFRLVVGHPQNAVLNDLLVPLFWRVGDEPELLPEVVQVWNAMVSNVALSETEIEQFNAIALTCNVPLCLDAQGRIVDHKVKVPVALSVPSYSYRFTHH